MKESGERGGGRGEITDVYHLREGGEELWVETAWGGQKCPIQLLTGVITRRRTEAFLHKSHKQSDCSTSYEHIVHLF